MPKGLIPEPDPSATEVLGEQILTLGRKLVDVVEAMDHVQQRLMGIITEQGVKIALALWTLCAPVRERECFGVDPNPHGEFAA